MQTSICSWIFDESSTDVRMECFSAVVRMMLEGPVAALSCKTEVGSFLEYQSRRTRTTDVPMDSLPKHVGAYAERIHSDLDTVIQISVPWRLKAHTQREEFLWIKLIYHARGAAITATGPFAPKRYNPRAEVGDLCILFGDEIHATELEDGAIANLIHGIIRSTGTRDLLVCKPTDTGSGAFFATHLFHSKAIDFLRDVMRQLFLLESYLVGWADVVAIGPPTRTIPSKDLCYGDPSLHRVETLCTSNRLADMENKCRHALALLRKRGENEVAEFAEFTGKNLFQLCNESDAVERSIRLAADTRILELLMATGKVKASPMSRGYLLKVNTVKDGETLQPALEALATQIVNPNFNWIHS